MPRGVIIGPRRQSSLDVRFYRSATQPIRFSSPHPCLPQRYQTRRAERHCYGRSVTVLQWLTLPSSHWVLTVHKKNWEPFVLGPALAMESSPGLVCFILTNAHAQYWGVSEEMKQFDSTVYLCNHYTKFR